MKAKILILTFILEIFITSCSMNIMSNTDSDQVLVKPSVLFTEADAPVSPDSVELIVVIVTYQNETLRDTFNYEDHTGTLSTYIPVNTQFTLRIEGIDSNGKVIYYGEQVFTGAVKDTTITITASQVSPWAPENLTVEAVDSSNVKLEWEDKSSNEMGFIIKRSEKDESSYIVIDTVIEDQEEKIDEAIKPRTVYYYKVMAYNAAGISDSIVEKYDPLEVVPTPTKPNGETEVTVDMVYFFWTDSIACGNGHTVQYRFDWGDNDISNWSYSQTGFHSWSKEGTYTIKVQARCSVCQDVVSDWSEGLEITVSDRKL